MSPNNPVRPAQIFRVAAAMGCALFAGTLAAKDHNVTVAIHVSTQGLDLRQPADALALYRKLKYAAHVACTDGARVGLEAPADPEDCYERALTGALRSLDSPLLTDLYLQTHTLRQASALGINVARHLVVR